MEKVTVYQFQNRSFDVIPEEHNISDSSRVTKSALPVALRNLGIALIGVIVGCVILYFIAEGIDRAMDDSGVKKVIGGGIAGCTIGLVFLLGLKVMAVFSSLFKPNLKTPEAAVRTFLSSLKKGLHERAYNLLTDTAQRLGKQDMPNDDMMQKKMPDLYFEDLDTFKTFWNSIQFPWKLSEFQQPKAQKINVSAALVEMPIDLDRIVSRDDERPFTAKFVTVKRGDSWFIANSFFWPQVE